MMNYVLSPSILAADFKVLGQEMKKTEENGAAYIHFDVMDGMFVPSISFGMPVLASINDATEQFMDAHLMVQEPIRYVEAFQKAGADYVTVHLEACEDVKTTLDKIHACGMKAGLAVNPETDVKELVPYLEDVEMILIMSVHPGFGGQKFIPESLDKIREVRAMLNEKKSGDRYSGRRRNLCGECQRSIGCRRKCNCGRFCCVQRRCRGKYCKIHGDIEKL